jgi:microcystin-dependent protein
MPTKQILIGIILILLIIFVILNTKSEHNTTINTNLTGEAIQNISSVYADTKGKAIFNNIEVTGNATIKNFKGIIVMWSGSETDIPDGWVLCNGSNNTPDLRGRFVLGSGQGVNLTNRELKQTGGTETHTLTVDELPPHNHLYRYSIGEFGPNNGQTHRIDLLNRGGDPNESSENKTKSTSKLFDAQGNLFDWGKDTRNGAGANKTVASYSFGAYTSLHNDSQNNYYNNNNNNNRINQKPHNNMPPFYVLAYIMKL